MTPETLRLPPNTRRRIHPRIQRDRCDFPVAAVSVAARRRRADPPTRASPARRSTYSRCLMDATSSHAGPTGAGALWGRRELRCDASPDGRILADRMGDPGGSWLRPSASKQDAARRTDAAWAERCAACRDSHDRVGFTSMRSPRCSTAFRRSTVFSRTRCRSHRCCWPSPLTVCIRTTSASLYLTPRRYHCAIPLHTFSRCAPLRVSVKI